MGSEEFRDFERPLLKHCPGYETTQSCLPLKPYYIMLTVVSYIRQ